MFVRWVANILFKLFKTKDRPGSGLTFSGFTGGSQQTPELGLFDRLFSGLSTR